MCTFLGEIVRSNSLKTQLTHQILTQYLWKWLNYSHLLYVILIVLVWSSKLLRCSVCKYLTYKLSKHIQPTGKKGKHIKLVYEWRSLNLWAWTGHYPPFMEKNRSGVAEHELVQWITVSAGEGSVNLTSAVSAEG